MTLGEFYEGNYVPLPDDIISAVETRDFHYFDTIPHYELYISRDGKDRILYIGISRNGIWDRWFGNYGRMKKNLGGYWYGTDSVSMAIIKNMPQSWKWKIELWTLDDCVSFISAEMKLPYPIDRIDISCVEPLMIRKLSPTFNGHYNT